MRPVGPDIPPSIASVLRDLQAQVRELQNPTRPPADFVVALEADLPPAESSKNCRAIVTEHNCLAISTDVAGTWTWLRADGTAL